VSVRAAVVSGNGNENGKMGKVLQYQPMYVCSFTHKPHRKMFVVGKEKLPQHVVIAAC